jgi:hypothetical protein
VTKTPNEHSERRDGPDGQKTQRERFVETARALGCDEDEAVFRDKLRVIARQKPKDEPKPTKPLERSKAGE